MQQEGVARCLTRHIRQHRLPLLLIRGAVLSILQALLRVREVRTQLAELLLQGGPHERVLLAADTVRKVGPPLQEVRAHLAQPPHFALRVLSGQVRLSLLLGQFCEFARHQQHFAHDGIPHQAVQHRREHSEAGAAPRDIRVPLAGIICVRLARRGVVHAQSAATGGVPEQAPVPHRKVSRLGELT